MKQNLDLMKADVPEPDSWMYDLAESEQRLKITLTNDFAFKKVFHNETALTGLLSALLDIDVKDIVEISVLDRVLPGEYPEDKAGILDVKIVLNHHMKINIEIQVAAFPHWEERSLFYTAKYFVEGFGKGEDYHELEQTIHISILSFLLSEEDGLYSVFEFRNRDTQRLYSDKMNLRVLQLKNLEFATEEEKRTEIYQWARMISSDDWEVLLKMAEHNEYMKAAVDEMERINAQKELRHLYLQREKKLHDEATIKRYYTELGIKEGREEGREEAREEGIRILITCCHGMGRTYEEVFHLLSEEYHLSTGDVEFAMKKYWSS